MLGETSKKKKKLQARSPQSPVTSSVVVEDATPAAEQEFYKKVNKVCGCMPDAALKKQFIGIVEVLLLASN